MNIRPKDGTAATQLPTARGAQYSALPKLQANVVLSARLRVGARQGCIRYGVCLPHSIPPMAPSPGSQALASGLGLSNKHNQPFSLNPPIVLFILRRWRLA